MKPVGKQLQEARLAKNWTPELAARETKIKVDRLHDLETDDYSHFSSPTYARGFVRTYARALGLDEYKILRQLDSKLPDDDSANIVTDTGVAYLPETSLPPRAAHQDFTGLYIVMGLGAVVTLAIVFVLFEAYRVGELSRWFGNNDGVVATTQNSTNSASDTARALPADGSAPPPAVVVETPSTNAPAADTNATTQVAAPETNAPVALKALPVDASATGGDAPAVVETTKPAPRALPVNAPSPTQDMPASAIPTAAPVPPRAMPVTAAELAALPANPPPVAPVALPVNAPVTNTPAQEEAPPVTRQSLSSKMPNQPVPRPVASAPAMEPPLPPVAPPAETNEPDKPLILTASQDSFVRVTNLDSNDTDKPVYAAVLRSGQSIAFSGRKFSINVGVPSAVDIKLDGVNYGPHSDRTVPETFTVQSHLQ